MVLYLDEARDRHPKSDRVICYIILYTEYDPRLVLQGSRSTYDIMHNGGYLALPTYNGERRLEIECASRPTTIPFPLSVTLGHLDTWILGTWNIGHLVTLTHSHAVTWTLGFFGTWNLE